jgi:glycosyltransferase involved in cell wall biosynthesis
MPESRAFPSLVIWALIRHSCFVICHFILFMPENSPQRIIQITPGAGKMFCGACLRDNALVAALRKLGHAAMMAPLYLPLTLDEEDQSAGTPLFFNGINVYLEQQSALFRRAPEWLHQALASPALLKWASGAAAKTRPMDLGAMTLSMLRGEEGNQARELENLLDWLRGEKPDVVSLSNALLVGMARRIKTELRVPVLCSLQGEDWFLDALPSPDRELAWQTAAERAADVDLFIAPSRYFADLMQRRLKLPPDRVRVLANGLNLDGYAAAPVKSDAQPAQPPVLGYFARMCREKGLETLVNAFIILKKRGRVGNLKLRIGGSCGPADEVFVDDLRARLQANGLLADVEFHKNVSRADKQAFLRSLSVFSVPATYGEAFGLYVIEALACGVPVVQPQHAAFPELIAATGGGLLCAPGDEPALADAIESLLLDPARARSLGEAGQKAVREKFSIETMARQMAELCHEARRRASSGS